MNAERARKNIKINAVAAWRVLPWNGRGDRLERRILKRRVTRARRLLDRLLKRQAGA